MPNTSPHVARYFARVDAHLSGLDAGECEKFLNGQISRWEGLYGEFIAKAAAGKPTSPEVTAFDFRETLDGLARRMPVKVVA